VTPRVLFNPISGETETENTTVADLRMWDAQLSDQISPLWIARENIRTAIADRTEPGALPRPQWRTDTQTKVYRCPRCREKYDAKEAAA
jgi:hypothetical protein